MRQPAASTATGIPPLLESPHVSRRWWQPPVPSSEALGVRAVRAERRHARQQVRSPRAGPDARQRQRALLPGPQRLRAR
ncbi:hypothetical protein D7X96_39175, partial [Corallococcus interemptor]